MAIALVQPLPHVNSVAELTPIERARLDILNMEDREAVDANPHLEPYQKTALVTELIRRNTNTALQRELYREPANIMHRAITIQTSRPETLCQTFMKGGVWGVGMAAFYANPVVTGTAVGAVYASSQIFDDECFINKFFQWIGCLQKNNP